MSDSYREQRPLLCDDYSDEEIQVKGYNYQKRNNRTSARSGRAQDYAQGAAKIITRWPDNCSTSVAYWWVAVSMIAITIFVIYNSVLIFGMIPKSDFKVPKYRTYNNDIKSKAQTFPIPEVYMHLIINNSSDANFNKYITFATNLTKKYPNFKYTFYVVFNDTAKDYHDFNDDEINEIAFNSLWKFENTNRKTYTKHNMLIKNISLTTYLNDSPIKKFWRHLPSYLIEFMVRSVSIWEKGGIALNPKIFIPNHENSKYIDKIYEVFDNFTNSSSTFKKTKSNNFYRGVSTRRPNNIRDIINALDIENSLSNTDLSEEETNDVVVLNTENIIKFKRDLWSNSKVDYKNLKENKNLNESDKNLNKNTNTTNNTKVIQNVLPLFLKYLFENKHKNEVATNVSDTKNLDVSKRNASLLNSLIRFNQNQSLPTDNIKEKLEEHDFTLNNTTYKHLSGQILKQSILNMNKNNFEPELSIDIKGNIIATKTGCHAFLGTMFSNVFRHVEDKTLTDFIICELSLFCNGLLRSCDGVNVILV